MALLLVTISTVRSDNPARVVVVFVVEVECVNAAEVEAHGDDHGAYAKDTRRFLCSLKTFHARSAASSFRTRSYF